MRKLAPFACTALAVAALSLSGSALAAPAKGPRHDGPASRAEAAARTDELFARLDANGDGLIDPKDRQAREGGLFAKLDADHDGTLSPQEFAAGAPKRGAMHMRGLPRRGGPMAMHGMRGGKMDRGFGPPMMKRGAMLRAADTDNDGAISKVEFEAATLGRFDAADADHDGSLTGAERHAAKQAKRGERAEKFRAMREEWRARRDAAGE